MGKLTFYPGLISESGDRLLCNRNRDGGMPSNTYQMSTKRLSS
jgi:hypothetical protein